MKAGTKLDKIREQIASRINLKKDLVVPVQKMHFARGVDDSVHMVVADNAYAIQPIAHQQLIEFTKIPGDYYKTLLADDPDLLITNLNKRVVKAPEKRRMVRTMGQSVRAVLSDAYRRFDNEDFADQIIPVLSAMDLDILSAELTDSRLYFKCIDKSVHADVPTGKSMGDGGHTIFDTVCPAMSIANSEVGLGALLVETGTYTQACTNLALFGPVGGGMRKRHTGARADFTDDVYALLSDETKAVSDAAIWLQVKDVIKAAWSEEKLAAVAAKLGQASSDPVADPEEAVKVLAKVHTLSNEERKGVMLQLIRSGDLTRYGLHAAVTRHSQDIESYDRATFFEQLGGKIIDLPKGKWNEINRKAA